jgi:hypothetical protein
VQLSLESLASILLPGNESKYVLGNNLVNALALYASLQMAEFFGTTAVAHKFEEFCHSPFGIKNNHHLWIMGQKEEAVSKRLKSLGLRLSYVELYKPDIFTQLFESFFLFRI